MIMKTPTKTEPASRPKAADTLIAVAEAVLQRRPQLKCNAFGLPLVIPEAARAESGSTPRH